MSGFEGGAIQSIRSNANLRAGSGQLFKNQNKLNSPYVARTPQKEDARLIARATAQKNNTIKNYLLVLLVAATVALSILEYLL